MMKRIFVLALTIALFSTQSFAMTGDGLKAAYDELAYTMEVEGAALTTEGRAAATGAFAQRVAALQEAGLTNAELIQFVKSQIKDKKVAAEITATYSLLQSQKLSQEEVHSLLNDMTAKMYSQGASWNGDVQTYLIIGGVIALVIALAVLIPADPCSNEAFARGNIEQCQNSYYNGRYYNI